MFLVTGCEQGLVNDVLAIARANQDDFWFELDDGIDMFLRELAHGLWRPVRDQLAWCDDEAAMMFVTIYGYLLFVTSCNLVTSSVNVFG